MPNESKAAVCVCGRHVAPRLHMVQFGYCYAHIPHPAQLAELQECRRNTIAFTIRDLRSSLAAAKQLIDGWEMLGVTITGCTNHSGRVALDDAKWQNEMHLRVSAELLSAANDKLAAAQQLGDAERDLVTATMRWRDYDETHDPKDPGWTTAPFVGFLQAVGRYRLALRAAAGKPDAG